MNAPVPFIASEQRHRRWILLGVGALVIAGTTPVFGHHVVSPVLIWPGLDHLGAICLRALQVLFSPIHEMFHWVIIAGFLYAAFDRLRALLALHRALGTVRGVPPRPGDVIWRAAKRAGLAPSAVRVVPFLPNPAFTTGFIRPKVFVSHSLGSFLSVDELAAVLSHEHSHLVRRDPLRLTLLRAITCTLFWLPAFRRLAEDWSDEAEILADDAAAASVGKLPLASAILALAQWPHRRLQSVPGFGDVDLVDRRIRRLVGEYPPTTTHVTRVSLGVAFVALALVWTSGAVMLNGRALAVAGSVAHCEHHDTSALSHLFCRRAERGAPAGGPCPHETALLVANAR